MDLLSDIMEVTALPDLPKNSVAGERAELVRNCWGRRPRPKPPTPKTFKRIGRGRSVPRRMIEDDFTSFNSNIKAQFERVGIAEDTTNQARHFVNKNGYCATRIKPVLTFANSSNFDDAEFPDLSSVREKYSELSYSKSSSKKANAENGPFSTKPNRCTFNKNNGSQWKFDNSIWENSGNSSFSLGSTQDDQKEEMFSFKDMAASLIQPGTSLNIEKLKMKDIGIELNDEAAIEIYGFSLAVSEESVRSYIASFGCVKHMEFHKKDDEMMIRIWMNTKSECEWVLSCLDGQESPVGDSERILSVNYFIQS